jgi:hypothetical protein
MHFFPKLYGPFYRRTISSDAAGSRVTVKVPLTYKEEPLCWLLRKKSKSFPPSVPITLLRYFQ